MKNFASRLLLAFFLLVPVAAFAQSTGTVVADCTTGVGLAYTPGSTRPMTLLPTGSACVSASVSASISGFTAASTGTPISVTTGGVTGNLPAGAVVVATNVGTTNGAYCALGASATTASQYIAPNGGWFAFTVGASTQLTCITSTSTTTVNMTGGAGLPTGTGGGGGSGGGGAITAAINSYAAGALSAGSLAAGAGVDGWDLTQGAKADSACGTATGTCSLISLIKYLNTSVNAAIPAGSAIIGKVGIDQTTPGTTNLVALAANQSVNVAQVNGVTTLTGTGATGTGAQRVTVATDQATNAGAALKNGGVGVVNGASTYQHIAASATNTVLGATGAAGDYLSHCVIYPGTTGAGSVTVFDNTNSAANIVIEFTSGTLSNLAPIPIPVGAVSTGGAWKITTGTNVTVACFGKFT